MESDDENDTEKQMKSQMSDFVFSYPPDEDDKYSVSDDDHHLRGSESAATEFDSAGAGWENSKTKLWKNTAKYHMIDGKTKRNYIEQTMQNKINCFKICVLFVIFICSYSVVFFVCF
jgi:hypothetical protein